jgi:hypothetical protein
MLDSVHNETSKSGNGNTSSEHNDKPKSDDGDVFTPEEIDEILKQLEKGY